MKRIPASPRLSKLSSFTLVELLVVIAIIAILASVILYSAGYALKAAKRAKAQNLAVQIQTGALAYYTEYSVYPVPPPTGSDYILTDVAAKQTAWGTLICILCGNIQPTSGTTFTTAGATITNSRGIAFMTLRATDVDAGNAPLNPVPTGTQIYFNIAMDSDYDGILGAAPSAVLTMPNFTAATFNAAAIAGGGTSTAGVAVWGNCNGTTSITNAGFWVHTY